MEEAIQRVVGAVAHYARVTPADILSERYPVPLRRARDLLILILRRGGYSWPEIARIVGRSRSNVQVGYQRARVHVSVRREAEELVLREAAVLTGGAIRREFRA